MVDRLTQDFLRDEFDYNPFDGWLYYKGTNRKVDFNYSTTALNTRYFVSICGATHPLAKLVWLYVYGEYPERPWVIDHINGVPSDNRIANLAKVITQQNTYRYYHGKSYVVHLPN